MNAKPLTTVEALAPAGRLQQGRGRIVRPLGSDEAEESAQEPARSANHPKSSVLRAKVLEHLNSAGRFLSRPEVASAMKRSGVAVGYHLRDLLEEGLIQAIGRTNSRRYGAVGVAAPADGSPAPVTKRAAPAKAKKRSKAKAKPVRAANLGEIGAAPKPQLPALAEPRGPGVTENPTCAIEDSGLFAINDGTTTIRLGRKGIAKVVRFLELTQHVWKGAA